MSGKLHIFMTSEEHVPCAEVRNKIMEKIRELEKSFIPPKLETEALDPLDPSPINQAMRSF